MQQYCRLGNNTSKCFDCFNIVGGFEQHVEGVYLFSCKFKHNVRIKGEWPTTLVLTLFSLQIVLNRALQKKRKRAKKYSFFFFEI